MLDDAQELDERLREQIGAHMEAAGVEVTVESLNALTEETQKSSHNALKSLWGDGPKRSYHRAQEINGGVGKKKGERPQEIYTPQSIIDAVLQVWPEGIALDPCSGWQSQIPASRSVVHAENVCGLTYQIVSSDPPLTHQGITRMFGRAPDNGGLGMVWPKRTYVNPPYRDLKRWLPKCAEAWECIALVPSRSHRTWWCDAADKATQICDLRPLKFVGYDQAFPAPLCVMYWGDRTKEFAFAFGDLGRCYRRLPWSAAA